MSRKWSILSAIFVMAFLAMLAGMAAVQQPAVADPATFGQPVQLPDTEEQRIQDLITANRILADQGVVDGFGHVSVRSLKNPSHYYIPRRQAPALITRADILEYDENSQPIDPKGPQAYSKRYIHGEIYRVRPDVQAVVHSRSPAVIPFTVTTVPLRPVMHMAGFLPQATPVFEIRKYAGEDNGILVVNAKTGAGLAHDLGQESVVLVRGHGMAVVASSVREVVFRCIYTQQNAQIEAEALRLGQPVFLNPREAAKVDAVNQATMLKAWDLWEGQSKVSPLSALRK